MTIFADSLTSFSFVKCARGGTNGFPGKHSDHFQQGESRWRLEQVALRFSLDLEAEAGVVIAQAKTRAG